MSIRRKDRRIADCIEVLEGRVLLTNNQALAAQIYIDVLSRPADAVGLANATAVLDAGVSASALARSLESSLEYRRNEVDRIYETFLHRQADPMALIAGASLLGSGTSDTVLTSIIIDSREFYKEAGSTLGGVGEELYEDALGRPIDAKAQTSLASQLASGISPAAIAAGLLASIEYRRDLVDSLYERYLGRAADPTGMDSAVVFLQSGEPEQLAANLIESAEYAEKVAGK